MFEIKKYRVNNEIVLETAKQITKDFAKYNLDIAFSEEIKFVYAELFSQLKDQLADLIAVDYGRVMSLLYQIDINENALKYLNKQNPDIAQQELMAELIIRREMQKVVTHLYLKKQSEENE